MRSNKIAKQFRNPYGIKSGSKLMEIMNAYRQACEKNPENITFSGMKGGKVLSTTLPGPWLEDVERWALNYRNTLGKAFIDACAWYVCQGGEI